MLAEFDKYAGVVGLKVGLAIGQTDFAKEQADIIGPLPAGGVAGGVSAVDIVVATPGRLMDHMERTPGFTLQHLTFLVIDEVRSPRSVPIKAAQAPASRVHWMTRLSVRLFPQ